MSFQLSWFYCANKCLLQGKGLQTLIAMAIEDMAQEALEDVKA